MQSSLLWLPCWPCPLAYLACMCVSCARAMSRHRKQSVDGTGQPRDELRNTTLDLLGVGFKKWVFSKISKLCSLNGNSVFYLLRRYPYLHFEPDLCMCWGRDLTVSVALADDIPYHSGGVTAFSYIMYAMQIRKTKTVSVFMIGFGGHMKFEGPLCENGTAVAWRIRPADSRYHSYYLYSISAIQIY